MKSGPVAILLAKNLDLEVEIWEILQAVSDWSGPFPWALKILECSNCAEEGRYILCGLCKSAASSIDHLQHTLCLALYGHFLHALPPLLNRFLEQLIWLCEESPGCAKGGFVMMVFLVEHFQAHLSPQVIGLCRGSLLVLMEKKSEDYFFMLLCIKM